MGYKGVTDEADTISTLRESEHGRNLENSKSNSPGNRYSDF